MEKLSRRCSEPVQKLLSSCRKIVRNVPPLCPALRKISAVIVHSPEQQNTTLATLTPATPAVPSQAETDAQLIDLWLHGRSRHTKRAYKSDAGKFFARVGKPLHSVTLADLQRFADSLGELKPVSAHRALSAVKSLFAFAHRLGYVAFDVAAPLRLPGIRAGLSFRILTEAEVQLMLALEKNPRNHAALTLLYAGGLRVSELCSLRWEDLYAREDGGQVTVFGKGEKTRVILLPATVWVKLLTLRGEATEFDAVFRSRKKGHLHPSQVWRIVTKASRRAGISKAVSTHWLRHAHASHALDRGAPISLVQATLGHASVATTGRYLHGRPSDSSSKYLSL